MSLPTEFHLAGPHLVGGEGEVILVSERLAVQIGRREIIVTPTQFRLLTMLVGEPGRTLSRTELVEGGIGTLVTERTVDVHIKELRRKLGPNGLVIETVRGLGYRYQMAEVQEQTRPPEEDERRE